MPVISFANPKGGAGKTTSALLLAGELAARGASIAIVDADPERWISQWGNLPGKPANITIISDITEDTIVDVVEEASGEYQFVIIDLEGTASLMDAKGASKTIKLIRNQSRLAKREIPYAVLLTRVSAAVTSRSLKNVRDQLDAAGIEVMSSSIVERAAYRDLLDFGGLLGNLDPKQVSNVDKAVQNAMEFTAEVIARLKAVQAEQGRAA